MWRMILVTFAFLGYAFYEISGGSDFEPRLIEVERTSSVVTVDEPEDLAVPQVEEDRLSMNVVQTTPVMTPTSPGNAKSVRVPDTGASPSAVAAATPDPDQVQLSLSRIGAQIQQGISLDVRPTPAQPTEAAAEPLADLREITGLRVNMRDGPGLAYPVMRRLALGQEVEVLDRASGWMRLRLPADGTVGWVSGSLVSDAKLN